MSSELMGLFHTAEGLAMRVAGLTAGLIASDKLGIKEMILTSSQGSDLEEAVRYTAYLVAVEYATDEVLERTLGIRAPSLHKDVGVGFLTSFATNTAVYYVMERTDILDKVMDNFEGSDEQRALGNALVYAAAQEISTRIITMWIDRSDPSNYGSKFQFNN